MAERSRREDVRAANRARSARPEQKRKDSERHKASWKSPAFRERRMLARRKWLEDPSVRESHRAYMRKYVKERKARDPEFAEMIRLYARKSQRWKVTQDDIRRKKSEQNWRCAICGEVLPKRYHKDHILPKSKGGARTYENLQLTCPTCNISKGDRLHFFRPDGVGMLALGFAEGS